MPGCCEAICYDDDPCTEDYTFPSLVAAVSAGLLGLYAFWLLRLRATIASRAVVSEDQARATVGQLLAPGEEVLWFGIADKELLAGMCWPWVATLTMCGRVVNAMLVYVVTACVGLVALFIMAAEHADVGVKIVGPLVGLAVLCVWFYMAPFAVELQLHAKYTVVTVATPTRTLSVALDEAGKSQKASNGLIRSVETYPRSHGYGEVTPKMVGSHGVAVGKVEWTTTSTNDNGHTSTQHHEAIIIAYGLRQAKELLQIATDKHAEAQERRAEAQAEHVRAAGAGAGFGARFGRVFIPMGAAVAPAVVPTGIAISQECPQCHKSLPDGAKFCLSCGSQVPQRHPVCGGCSAELPAEARFCMKCGHTVEAPLPP